MRSEKRKNILFTSSAPHVAGGEINLLALLDTIDTTKFIPYCLYQPGSHFETYDLNQEVTLIPFNFVAYNRNNIFNVTVATFKLFFLLLKYEIDLIYINTACDIKFFLPLLRFINIPIILHVHVDESDDFFRWIRVEHASRILFPSKFSMLAALNHSPWLQHEKCFYLHNAVDLTKYYPHSVRYLKKELEIDQDCYVIGIIGQIKKIKGQDLFLEMARNLILHDVNAFFVIVGEDNSTDKSFEQTLRVKVKKWGIDGRVRFLGFRRDVPEIMSLCDLLIVPSLREPFGRVVIEAMACGTPVVASAVGGMVEIFEDGVGGLFFERGSVADLTDKVMYFINHPRWWDEQKKIALKVCHDRFSQIVHTSRIEKHIIDLLDRHAGV